MPHECSMMTPQLVKMCYASMQGHHDSKDIMTQSTLCVPSFPFLIGMVYTPSYLLSL